MSDKDPLVNKLRIWRSNRIAHYNTKLAIGKNDVLKRNPISNDEIQKLLDRSIEIYNKYLQLYRASIWSINTIGNDDYKSLLKLLRVGRQKQEDDFQKEIAQWQNISAS